MKKVIVFSMICILTACSKDLSSLNEDIKNATTASAGSFFANALRSMADEMNDMSYQVDGGATRLFAQQLTSVTYLEGTHYVAESQYNTLWRTIYSGVLGDLKASEDAVRNTVPIGEDGIKMQQNQLAMITIWRVYAYETLVEAFGNIPYSDALDYNNVLPKYDDASTVYVDLMTTLENAVDLLDPSTSSGFGASDLLYKDQVDKWKKFGYSLLLKMGMRIMDAQPDLGEEMVAKALNGGVFTSNSDNALFAYLDGVPNTSPFYIAITQGQVNYYVATDVLMDGMNSRNDPRRPVFFTTVGGQFRGGAFGYPLDYNSYSHLSSAIVNPTVPTVIMDYSSVEFFLAEAAERGISGISNAAEHYNKAITASMDYYGVGAQATDYLNQPSVAYVSAEGTWKEKIGYQKWVALFNQGFEAWTEYRRLDSPGLSAPPDAIIPVVPRRFNYPFEEQTLNGDNYTEASSAIGGDLMTTNLFWDKF